VPGESAGSYQITATLSAAPGVLNNYNITNKGATFTINPAPLTITPAAGQSKVYGAAVPTPLSYTFSGLVNNDPASTLTGVLGTSATAASPVGNYAFTTNLLQNYTVVLAANAPTFAVTPAPLTITAADQSMVYGAALPALTVSYSGLVNGDIPSTFSQAPNMVPSISTTAAASSHVGSYPITAGGAADRDYYITCVPGTLMVTPAPLTITGTNQTKIQAEVNPPITVSYSGFVLGEGPSVLGGTLTCSTTATKSSPAGTYAITPAGLTSSDYAITFVSGTLTVISYSQAMTNLQAQVDTAGLPQGTQNSLDSKLQAAIASFTQGDTTAAKNQLGAFINEVSAQRGKKIDPGLADALTAYAQRIINAVA
jgi:hypothetical protein